MRNVLKRLEGIERRAQPAPAVSSAAERFAWCRANGIDPTSVLLGSPTTGVVVLPALEAT